MGLIIFNNQNSRDLGIEVECPPVYVSPEKDYDIIHVPGKNGDVIIDKGSFKNVERAYKVTFSSAHNNFTYISNLVIGWLHSSSGYAVLEDSYEPEYYRLAMYKDSCSIENLLGQAGTSIISFDCKPQRFLKSGDKKIEIIEPCTIYNPTRVASSPIVTVKGDGNGILRIGKYLVTLRLHSGTPLTINSEIQDVYAGSTNQNGSVLMSNGFPKLESGNNEIYVSKAITSVEVIPKWWTL